MGFDITLHEQVPAGFDRGENSYDSRAAANNPMMQTVYEPSEGNIKMYGVELLVGANLQSRFKPSTETASFKSQSPPQKSGMLGRVKNAFSRRSSDSEQENAEPLAQQIKEQTATISLMVDPTYDGHEKTKDEEGMATRGESRDTEKVQTANVVIEALMERWKDKGYVFEHTKNMGYLSIELPQNDTAPLQAFAAILHDLQKLQRQYEEGEKPLDDITEPSGTIKIKAHIPASLSPRSWGDQEEGRRVSAIMALVETHLPVGKTVTQETHESFQQALKEYFSKGR